jgi:hypothetical protein
MKNKLLLKRPENEYELRRMMRFSGAVARIPVHYVMTDGAGCMFFPSLMIASHMNHFWLEAMLNDTGIRRLDMVYNEMAAKRGQLILPEWEGNGFRLNVKRDNGKGSDHLDFHVCINRSPARERGMGRSYETKRASYKVSSEAMEELEERMQVSGDHNKGLRESYENRDLGKYWKLDLPKQ